MLIINTTRGSKKNLPAAVCYKSADEMMPRLDCATLAVCSRCTKLIDLEFIDVGLHPLS